MSDFISRIHSTIRAARTTRRGATMRAEDVPMGVHKEYPRMPRILLPSPEPLTDTLDEAIRRRRSFNDANELRGCTPNELGTLLGVALGMRDDAVHRNYPSSGSLFPIETYLIGKVLEGTAPGVFHYHPKAHALEQLVDLPSSFSTLDVTSTNHMPTGSMLIVFTASWQRSSAKYGDLAYLHATIEVGHMAQNILLVATAHNILVRPIAGFRDAELTALLDLDPRYEQPLYAIVVAPAG
jgi:SagB-type dehydrogenase family enzyme